MKYILFGASGLGRQIFEKYNDSFNFCYFCDNDPRKWGKQCCGLEILSPQQLSEYPTHTVMITSKYKEEISRQLEMMGFSDYVTIDQINILYQWLKPPREEIPRINLGKFLINQGAILKIKDLAFMAGGSSGLLDYLFLQALMNKFNLKNYLEVGTFLGESIATISEKANKCFSISLPDESMDWYFKKNNKSNFSRYFSKQKPNVYHYQVDSKEFDYTLIKDEIDLVFIDGNHSYQGVYTDTCKIFSFIQPEKTFVVWHDFKKIDGNYRLPTLCAIFDAISPKLQNRVFGVDNNLCGIYIPEKYLSSFDISNEADKLYSYEIDVRVKVNKINGHEGMESI